jgi:hypothetical protein
MFARIRQEEDGIAMIVALMVSFVVLLMSVAVLAQSTHNVQQAGYDRKRLTAIGGAEAGIDYMYNYFQRTPALSLVADPVASAVQIGTSPNTTSYDTSVTYYSNSTGTVSCAAGTQTTCHTSARVVSVGTSSDGTKRVMETFMVLRPVTSGSVGAIITNSDTTFSGNFTLSGVDSDVYVLTGDFTSPSGLESINGGIYVPQGSANIGTNVTIAGAVFARDQVTLNHPSLIVGGAVESSTRGVTQTAGTVNGQIHYCPSYTAPAGAIGDCPSPVPGATDTFPHMTFTASDWTTTQEDGTKWYVVNAAATASPPKTACAVARDAIEAGVTPPSGYTGVVYYIADTCVFTNSPSASTINLNGDLAIVAEGGINLGNSPNFVGVGGTRKLIFEAPWPASGSPSCSATEPSLSPAPSTLPYTVALGNQVGIDNATVNAFVYGACWAIMNNNNSSFNGQVMAQHTTIGNLFSMNYQQMLVPGQAISGFKEDVAYIREITCPNSALANCGAA